MASDLSKRTYARARTTIELKPRYDFIVCGSGASGSVVAGRLAQNSDVRVLLLEAGGDDNVPAVTDAIQWPLNLGSLRDWGFRALPNPHINGRSITFSMGKVLGGGSSINVMTWARGHRNDWDFYAAETRDSAWNYDSVLGIYRRMEDWHGVPDPKYRGTGGPVFVEPAPNPNPVAPATVAAARSAGIPAFENPNGRMMEAACGASIADIRARAGKRESAFHSYVVPHLSRPNLTVLTHALVTRVVFEGKRAVGVEINHGRATKQIRANFEVVLSLGSINTPKVLLQSGIGDPVELARVGIPLVQDLPGVGQNFQDHVGIGCVWEYREPQPPRNTMSEAVIYWNNEPGLKHPDLFACQAEIPLSTEENAAQFGSPAAGWSLFGSMAHPRSTGRLRLTGRNPSDPIVIEANTLADPEDLKMAITCIERLREIGNSPPLSPFVKREVMPGNLRGDDLERFIRNAATTFWHQTCTAKMGQDAMSVVDGRLQVYGIENLSIADGSILPRLPTGNTMAPCMIIGERAAEILSRKHNLGSRQVSAKELVR
jgi:choline dehydrogenase